ncbi:cbb3-type cytochrome oxidase assembly protein CcoS [Herbaspirillum sp. meg3]|uniref:cbb3-type cytochrome oxidase assembly protein CcoS n=1 Tax=Herbaspirillum sp. meg3 TaxID=2025949 RepID=UPI000B980FD1|nr:cbb3-type cytochrome oxidase assembly protein CcoS [Herbaspirillum sp. meg3]ASU38865.1 cbb3-type cytochrome oxidase assembly protein CcoS [Herbaspirillum sp. meg3]
MEALYLLVPLSIAVVFGAIWLFFRMSDGGQFDDLVSPGWRILEDDDKPPLAPVNETAVSLKKDTSSHR